MHEPLPWIFLFISIARFSPLHTSTYIHNTQTVLCQVSQVNLVLGKTYTCSLIPSEPLTQFSVVCDPQCLALNTRDSPIPALGWACSCYTPPGPRTLERTYTREINLLSCHSEWCIRLLPCSDVLLTPQGRDEGTDEGLRRLDGGIKHIIQYSPRHVQAGRTLAMG